MANKIILVVVMACLAAFGLRGVLPALLDSGSISIFTDALFILAAIALAGVAFYEVLRASPAPKLK
jgi:hypothetical protein